MEFAEKFERKVKGGTVAHYNRMTFRTFCYEYYYKNHLESLKIRNYLTNLKYNLKRRRIVNMHKIFGVKEQEEYYNRQGAYIIPIRGNEVGVVETPKGFFLLGGGLDSGESVFQCIKRECLEEAGYEVEIGKEVASAETYMLHPTIGYFHPIQKYYLGKLLNKVKNPVEPDHVFRYVRYEEIKGKMYLEMQNWAIEQAWSMR